MIITKQVKSTDGTVISYNTYNLPKKPIANVLMIHGLGDHSKRMLSFVGQKFCDSNLLLIAPDQRGHGESGGLKGHSPSIDQTLKDFECALTDGADPTVPTFIYGHSFGGCLALHYTLKHKQDVRGCVATAPLIQSAVKVPGAKVFFGTMLSKVAGTTPINSGVNHNHISRDEAIVKGFKDDPLCHNRISLTMGAWLLSESKALLKLGPSFTNNLLIVHPSTDKITSFPASKQFFDSVQSTDKSFKPWDEVYHELHAEKEGPEILDYIINWINGKIGGGTGGGSGEGVIVATTPPIQEDIIPTTEFNCT